MRTETLQVTYKDQKQTITIVLQDNMQEYEVSWDRAPGNLVWYEKLGFKARGHVNALGHIVLGVPDVKLLGHELLHKFGVHHPNGMFPALAHVVKCGFGIASFSGVFRWRDAEEILPEAYRVMKRLTR